MKKVLLLVAFILLVALSAAAETKVFGSAKEYANSEIIFYRYKDRITFLEEKVFSLKFDTAGNFSAEFSLDEITYLFAEFGVYYVYFYAEPNGIYELVLPEYVERTSGDIFNPYFKPTEMQLGIKNMKTSDLNYLIMDFDYYYNRYHDLNLEEMYTKGLESDIDTFINSINARYENVHNDYFTAYKRYRIAALKNIVTHREYESALVYTYYTKHSVLYDNPAYMDLFNSIYKDYFDKYLISPNGPLLYAVINYGHSISRLNKLMARNIEHTAQQFKEIVMLKGLNDAFANDNLQWLPLLLTLDSLYISTEYPKHREIAQNIADNSLTMAKGTVALPFELPDTAGIMHNLDDYKGKCLYLGFANTETFSSQAEFDVLKRIYERYKGVCQFVVIITDTDRDKAKQFIAKNDYNWTFLFAELNDKVLSDYKVVAYPTYFFIDSNGTLILSPAPSPSENFERNIFQIIDNKHEKQKK